MWRRCGVVVLAMVVLAGARGWAGEPAMVAAAQTGAAIATDAECKVACGSLVARCAGVFGPRMGDMRPFCERAVVRRCRALGVAVCAVPPDGGATP